MMIGKWMFGPAHPEREEEVVRISLDPRVGGSFSFVVRRQGQEMDHVGEYLEIERPRRLVFTWGGGERGRQQPRNHRHHSAGERV
ncbi:SRPBCC domain-containing protein [Polycladomyces zharkentensis]|uniref:SRPBCC domain-containing protein n=1 Tax=Polycladomyces zharkentensis TaxID=2807616 RepID=UPI002FFC393D